jgi:hypothetical protein
MSDHKILYNNDFIEVIENNNSIGIKEKHPEIFIILYSMEDDNINKIGLINESYEIISITPIKGDNNIFDTAKRGIKEKGIIIDDIEKWEYIGNISTNKLILNTNPCYSLDITNYKLDESNDIKLIDTSEAVIQENSLICCLFLKLFQSKLKD